MTVGVRRRYVRIMVRRGVVGAGGVYGRGYRRVWCSKFRCPVLAGPVGDRCGELVREKCAGYEWMVVAWEVTPDPVDLFVKVHLRHFPSCVADQLAGLTSRVLREGFGYLRFWLPALCGRGCTSPPPSARFRPRLSAGTLTPGTSGRGVWSGPGEAGVQVPAPPDGAVGRRADGDAR
ncbi:hypothetical protein FMEAI12_2910025 [Parafrankia sp. Ea1.12]|nr:hypothetical protein FMEAI12_2910025 [Parafrankia sp. Ea1.12]